MILILWMITLLKIMIFGFNEVVESKFEVYKIGYYKSFYERDSLYKNAIDFLD